MVIAYARHSGNCVREKEPLLVFQIHVIGTNGTECGIFEMKGGPVYCGNVHKMKCGKAGGGLPGR